MTRVSSLVIVVGCYAMATTAAKAQCDSGAVTSMNATLPAAKYSHDCAEHSATGKIYCFGGYNVNGSSGGYRNEITEYDPSTDTLVTKSATLPTARDAMSCVGSAANGKIYCFGGFRPGYLTDITEYNPATDTLVTKSARLPSGNNGISCADSPATGKIYCFGGHDGSGATSDKILEYNPATDTLVTKPETLPSSRGTLECATDLASGKIYCFGGFGPLWVDDIVEYNPATDTAVLKNAVMPTVRSSFSCAASPATGEIYCFGGHDAFTRLDDIVKYDPSSDTLVSIPQLLPSVSNLLVCGYGSTVGKIYCFGGIRSTNVYTDEIVEFTPCSSPVGVCGDGTCDAGEDSCACPQDCPGPCCGDGNVDPGEECDDGNISDGDGCSASCENEFSSMSGRIVFANRIADCDSDEDYLIRPGAWGRRFIPCGVTFTLWRHSNHIATWPPAEQVVTFPLNVHIVRNHPDVHWEAEFALDHLLPNTTYSIDVGVFGTDHKIVPIRTLAPLTNLSDVEVRMTFDDVEDGYSWVKKLSSPITYSYHPTLSSNATLIAGIERAIATWEQTGLVTFLWIAPPTNGHSDLEFHLSKPLADICGIGCTSRKFGFGHNYTRIDFANDETWTTDSDLHASEGVWIHAGGEMIERTALHEIGHALGLRYPSTSLLGPEGDYPDSACEQWSIMTYLGDTTWLGWSDVLALNRIANPGFRVTGCSPIELRVTDPLGRIVDIAGNEIPDAVYSEDDFDGDGLPDDRVTIPGPVSGEYAIEVIPDLNADASDHVTLIVEDHGQPSIVLDDVTVAELPTIPLRVAVDRVPPTMSIEPDPSVLSSCDDSLVRVTVHVDSQDDVDPAPLVALDSIQPSWNAEASDIQGADYAVDDREFDLRSVCDTAGSRQYTVTYATVDATGNVADATATVTVPRAIVIDIKPGDDTSSINLGSHGVIPVAILTTDVFDAATVDPDTVELAGSSVAIRGNGNRLLASTEDIDGDGDTDLIVHVETENLSLETGSTEAILTAQTFDGELVSGSDTINIVGDDDSGGGTNAKDASPQEQAGDGANAPPTIGCGALSPAMLLPLIGSLFLMRGRDRRVR